MFNFKEVEENSAGKFIIEAEQNDILYIIHKTGDNELPSTDSLESILKENGIHTYISEENIEIICH